MSIYFIVYNIFYCPSKMGATMFRKHTIFCKGMHLSMYFLLTYKCGSTVAAQSVCFFLKCDMKMWNVKPYFQMRYRSDTKKNKL